MIGGFFYRIRDSLFLLPASIIVVLGAASQLTLAFDGWRNSSDTWWLLPTTVDSARSILSTVATATVTVAAIVFSMTAVVVQLATSQFSPRVTQGFLRDRYQQITIGLTIGTFVYALLVLASVRDTGGTQDFSVTVAVVLAVASMVAIVSFIDRIMRSMRIDSIVRSLADRTERAIRALPDREELGDQPTAPPDTATVTTVPVRRSGWVRSIGIEAVLAALPGDTAVRIDLRTGDYMSHGEVAATVWPEVEESVAHAVAAAVELGPTRSISGDPSYGVRQMVDIGLRALSPSLNDATTGADVVHHLTGPLRAGLLRDLPGRVVTDHRGNRVYLPRALTHSDLVTGALQEIRLSAVDQPLVLRALLDTISSLIGQVEGADLQGRAAPLRREAEAVVDAIDRSTLPDRDKEDLLAFARSRGLADDEGAAAGEGS